MRYLEDRVIGSITIDKSEFIAILYPLSETWDVLSCIEDAKTRYPKANHYCSASISGTEGEHATSSDDGEPHRTAGIPILDVLRHHDVTEICAVVVRYFGGIKLGAGGLVRAYAKATALALGQADFYVKRTVPSARITFGYPLVDPIDRLLKDRIKITNKTFLEYVTYEIVYLEEGPSIFDDIKHQLIAYEALEDVTIHEKA